MNSKAITSLLLYMGHAARRIVSASLREHPVSERCRATGHSGSDVIYAIDRLVEEEILRMLSGRAAELGGVVLVAEGIGENETTVHPAGTRAEDCAWRILMDPIDGTRGIMMDKRSAWFLAGAAPNKGAETRLRDIVHAVMAELPTSRAAVADIFFATRGEGVRAETLPAVGEGASVPFQPAPWPGSSIRGGFAQLARFFPPGREHLAALEETLYATLFPDAGEGEILGFEDQYISTGGQLAELVTGKDRFTADVRAELYASPLFAGRRVGHVCHPYDLAGLLVAEEAGVEVTDCRGEPLDAPFDTRTPVSWIAYANKGIRREVESVLLRLIRERF